MNSTIKGALAVFVIVCVLAPAALWFWGPLGAHARARALIAAGEIARAAEIYARLAEDGDAVALNNLAVLKYRGNGIGKDGAEAARLFDRSAKLGLVRAKLNILLATTYACRNSGVDNVRRRASELEALIAAGDRLAASYLEDCLARADGLTSGGVTEYLDNPGERLIEAARVATAGGDADEHLHAGFMLATVAVRAAGGKGQDAKLYDMVPKLSTAAMQHFAAAEAAGRISALLGYSQLSALGDGLGDGALALRIRGKSEDGWLEAAADRGHKRSACQLGTRIVNRWRSELKTSGPKQPEPAEVTRFNGLMALCSKTPAPPGYRLKPGQSPADTLAAGRAYDRRFDHWMREDAFVIVAPNYPNFEQDFMEAVRARDLLSLLARERLEFARLYPSR